MAGPRPLGGVDTAYLFNKMFTNRIVATPAFPDPVEAVVVSATDSQVVVTVNGFDPTGQSTFTCNYQPVPGSGNPPQGTPCLIVFSANGNTPWVVAFSGWPS